MLFVLLFSISAFHFSAFSQTTVFATVTCTNSAGTTNGQTITVNGTVYTWKTTPTMLVDIATTNTAAKAATNLYAKFRRALTNQLLVTYGSSTSVKIQTYISATVTVTVSTNWATVSYATNTAGGAGVGASNLFAASMTLINSSDPKTITDWATVGGGGSATNVGPGSLHATNTGTAGQAFLWLTSSTGYWGSVAASSGGTNGGIGVLSNQWSLNTVYTNVPYPSHVSQSFQITKTGTTADGMVALYFDQNGDGSFEQKYRWTGIDDDDDGKLTVLTATLGGWLNSSARFMFTNVGIPGSTLFIYPGSGQQTVFTNFSGSGIVAAGTNGIQVLTNGGIYTVSFTGSTVGSGTNNVVAGTNGIVIVTNLPNFTAHFTGSNINTYNHTNWIGASLKRAPQWWTNATWTEPELVHHATNGTKAPIMSIRDFVDPNKVLYWGSTYWDAQAHIIKSSLDGNTDPRFVIGFDGGPTGNRISYHWDETNIMFKILDNDTFEWQQFNIFSQSNTLGGVDSPLTNPAVFASHRLPTIINGSNTITLNTPTVIVTNAFQSLRLHSPTNAPTDGQVVQATGTGGASKWATAAGGGGGFTGNTNQFAVFGGVTNLARGVTLTNATIYQQTNHDNIWVVSNGVNYVVISTNGYFYQTNSQGDATTLFPRGVVFNGQSFVGYTSGYLEVGSRLSVINTITNAALTASKLVGSDANKALKSVDVGSGLSFDGTTLSASGGGSLLVGRTLYVDAVNGNDSTATRGSASLPWLTVIEALKFMQAGDTMNIGPGTFQVSSTNADAGAGTVGAFKVPRNTRIQGAGIDVTTLWCTNNVAFTPTNNNEFAELTIYCTNNFTIASPVLPATYLYNSRCYNAVWFPHGKAATNVYIHNVRALADDTVIFSHYEDPSNLEAARWCVSDCQFFSHHGGAWFMDDANGNAGIPSFITGTAFVITTNSGWPGNETFSVYVGGSTTGVDSGTIVKLANGNDFYVEGLGVAGETNACVVATRATTLISGNTYRTKGAKSLWRGTDGIVYNWDNIPESFVGGAGYTNSVSNFTEYGKFSIIEADGSPSITAIQSLIVPNGSLSSNTPKSGTLTFSAGSQTPLTATVNAAQYAITNMGALGASNSYTLLPYGEGFELWMVDSTGKSNSCLQANTTGTTLTARTNSTLTLRRGSRDVFSASNAETIIGFADNSDGGTANILTINSSGLTVIGTITPTTVSATTVNSVTANLTGPLLVASDTLTDAATIATDASLGNHFRVTLAANRTLGNPTNPTDAQKATWEVIQDSTGNRTLAMATQFAFGTDITGITLTTNASKRDFITAVYNSTTTKWYVVGFVRGY
jgi:hypothetical protein